MTERTKKGLILIITGAICVAAGAILMIWTSTPTWVPIVLMVADVALTAIGLPLAYKPDVS